MNGIKYLFSETISSRRIFAKCDNLNKIYGNEYVYLFTVPIHPLIFKKKSWKLTGFYS